MLQKLCESKVEMLCEITLLQIFEVLIYVMVLFLHWRDFGYNLRINRYVAKVV